jgi:hypothetical protein
MKNPKYSNSKTIHKTLFFPFRKLHKTDTKRKEKKSSKPQKPYSPLLTNLISEAGLTIGFSGQQSLTTETVASTGLP